MRINKISVFQKTLPLLAPYWLSGGRLKFEKLDSTYIKIDTDAGLAVGRKVARGETVICPDSAAALLPRRSF